MLVTCAGILVADMIASDLPRISEPGEVVFTERPIELHIGGHAANVSVDLIKLGLKRSEVSAVGAVGEDALGRFIEETLEQYGVLCHLQKIRRTGTSKDMILVVKGQDRRYHVDIGANWHLDLHHLKRVLEEERPRIFYLGGAGFLGRLDERLGEILSEAKALGCLTFLDPVAPYRHGWDIFVPALEWADAFHCNNIEAERITGSSEPREAARLLINWGAKLAVITLGERGLIAATKDAVFEMPAFKVPVVDPTGAGDAFCSGVIRGLVKEMEPKRKTRDIASLEDDVLTGILLEGEAAGAACVTMVGTTTGVSRDRVDALIKEQGSTVLKNVCVKRAC
ncbi:MAG: hypothetical protein AYL32_000630 [Candidatus Bathyarchaeota archaeon B26-2]|nr:MAG: hypothetical protein AYL32_000630 [Candidatus Bathyarchaeota archaeon B26-2]